MADKPDDTPVFATDELEADRAIEHGQGVAARELAAQRDPGGVRTADEEPELEGGQAAPSGWTPVNSRLRP